MRVLDAAPQIPPDSVNRSWPRCDVHWNLPEKVAPTQAEGATRSNGLGSLSRRAAVGRSVSKTQARNSGVGGYFFAVFFVAVDFGAVVFAGAFSLSLSLVPWW